MHSRLVDDYVDDIATRRAPFREAHLTLAREAAVRGTLLLAGALAEPLDGAVFVFAADDASTVEDFVDRDPYVGEGAGDRLADPAVDGRRGRRPLHVAGASVVGVVVLRLGVGDPLARGAGAHGADLGRRLVAGLEVVLDARAVVGGPAARVADDPALLLVEVDVGSAQGADAGLHVAEVAAHGRSVRGRGLASDRSTNT